MASFSPGNNIIRLQEYLSLIERISRGDSTGSGRSAPKEVIQCAHSRTSNPEADDRELRPFNRYEPSSSAVRE